MKIKIGDITARQKQRICESRKSCQDCKLSRGWYFPECMHSDSSYFDIEVDLPDKYFDKIKGKEK